MPVFAVLYDYLTDSVPARDEHRPAHRQFLGTLTGPVNLLASGPYVDEPAGALLIVEATSVAEVETAMDADPFAVQGLISGRAVREWTQVKGPWA
ncbi:uncharacterized protein YciI [Nakamurella sp. UYEF19]|uniref:YciI family protein n=1 Tax=Nakamurella sp. UYEF19 TaxID=1756392 RepID=UPI003393B0E6